MLKVCKFTSSVKSARQTKRLSERCRRRVEYDPKGNKNIISTIMKYFEIFEDDKFIHKNFDVGTLRVRKRSTRTK